ncbi:MAG: hypothetical protein GY708_27415 [Actinomycetia bacterium]|nr:hypothetical protein [Actinomycetes bacterium]
MSWKCGDDLRTAREKVRTARSLDNLPSLAAAFGAGELSYSKVRAVTRIALPEDEAEWTETKTLMPRRHSSHGPCHAALAKMASTRSPSPVLPIRSASSGLPST